MSNGASGLNYQLCWDAACTDPIAGAPDRDVLVDRVGYDIPTYGEILANQTVPLGSYAQTVTVRVQY